MLHSIEKLKSNKSPGLADVTVEMIKAGGAMNVIKQLFNAILTTTPEQFKKVEIIVIYKNTFPPTHGFIIIIIVNQV